MLHHAFGMLFRPGTEWRRVAAMPENSLNTLLIYPCILAAIPAVAWYYGTSQVGWTVAGDSDAIRLTPESARQLTLLFYFAMLGCIASVGYFIHWMAGTYGAQAGLARGIVTAGLTVTPLFVFGIVGVYPLLWLDLLLGVVAVSWSVYLLYLGIPIMMGIPEERGFLFSSAVVAVGLVILVSLMVATVLLWDLGSGPAFIDAL